MNGAGRGGGRGGAGRGVGKSAPMLKQAAPAQAIQLQN
jgi:hypothetical protein